MKAAVIYEYGGIENVKVEDVPQPKPQKGEAVIKIKSCGLNHLDIWVIKGRSAEKLTEAHIIGSDASGIVQSAGAEVKNIKAGDEVVVNPGLSCGRCEYCRSGQNSECERFGITGLSRPGLFAEMAAVPAVNLYPKPAHMSFDEAGGFVLTFLTAWRMLMTKANLKSGQTVLIHGIGGGVATSSLQLAKLAGAEVIVTSSSDSKLACAKGLGADHTINYKREEDIAGKVKEITSGRGADIVIDSAGAATWPCDLAAVRKGGTIVLCGVTTGATAQTNLRTIYWNQLKIFGSTLGSDEDLRQMLKAVSAGKIKPVIDSVKTLSSVREALGRMEAAEQFGKIILKVS